MTDFFDELKSRSQGYASMEYHITGYRKNDLVRLDIKINNELAEPMANIVHRNNAYHVGRAMVKRLKELIPRQQFKVPIQAAIGAKIVAAESLSGILIWRNALTHCLRSGTSDFQGRILLSADAIPDYRTACYRHAMVCQVLHSTS